MTIAPSTVDIFGFRVRNTSMREAAETILRNAERGVRGNVFFVNAHCVNVAAANPEYCDILARADTVFADGVGLAIATRVAGLSLKDNVNGTDLFPIICEIAADRKIPIAMVGGAREIVGKCATKMANRFPGLNVVYTKDGYFPAEEDDEVINKINRSGARLLLVARGVPRQELWIDRVSDRLEVPQVMAVGGLFDFYSGRLMRAPVFIRKIGLEWVVRLIQEPRRLFRRYVFGNPVFLYRTLALRLRGRRVLQKELN